MVYIIGIILLILVICFFIVFSNYSKLKDIQVSIDACTDNINKVLNKKLEMINSLIEKLGNEKIKKDFVYDESASLYDREDALFNASFEINKYIKDNKKKKLKEDVRELNVLEENLDGLKDFYNANVLNYNEIFYKKLFNKIYKLLKFAPYKSFKVRKLEEYEIFKN